MHDALLCIVITLLMSSVMVAFGLPFLALAWAFARLAYGALSDGTRLAIAAAIAAIAAAIAAIGIAPDYDAYRGPLPIYMRLVRGVPVGLVAAVVSLAITWMLLFAVARVIARRRAAAA
jgi:hypothetical protein